MDFSRLVDYGVVVGYVVVDYVVVDYVVVDYVVVDYAVAVVPDGYCLVLILGDCYLEPDDFD